MHNFCNSFATAAMVAAISGRPRAGPGKTRLGARATGSSATENGGGVPSTKRGAWRGVSRACTATGARRTQISLLQIAGLPTKGDGGVMVLFCARAHPHLGG